MNARRVERRDLVLPLTTALSMLLVLAGALRHPRRRSRGQARPEGFLAGLGQSGGPFVTP